jgi:hypothetical protein
MQIDTDPATAVGYENASAGSIVWVDYRKGTDENGSLVEVTFGSSGNKSVDLQKKLCPIITLLVTASAAGAALNELTPGAFEGQVLMVCNQSSGSLNDITVNHNTSGLISLGSNMTVPLGRGLTFFWQGSRWRCVTDT